MDQSCSDFEFFDFNNASEEEIKEIQAILKGPGSNGCVELPWEIPLKENCVETVSQNESSTDKVESLTSKGDKALGSSVVGQFTSSPQNPLSPPVARLPPPPPPVEAFVAPPTTMGPYANAPYIVSRTIPFVRAYPHMGVPFFACPLPGAGGETSTMSAPYGQFVPMVPATVGQEKLAENDSVPKKPSSDRQLSRRNKKKLSNSESFECESAEGVVTGDEQLSAAVSSDRPTSVPLVPLPVPPSTFGTLPLHGYPPGLATLPYTQMSGPQAPQAAMYYVPVFNHPYGSYIPSPPSAPMVLPVNLRPDTDQVDTTTTTTDLPVTTDVVHSNCEQCVDKCPDAKQQDHPTAKTTAAMTDTSSSASDNKPLDASCDDSKAADEDDDVKDATRCWADLFKKPLSSEVNGISTEQSYENLNNLGKEVTNGKLYCDTT